MSTSPSVSNESSEPSPPGLLEADVWLRCLENEYLDTFIPAGGAAVKVAVVSDDVRDEIISGLRDRLKNAGFSVFDLTSAAAPVHSVDQFWFAVAALVDWEHLAHRIRVRIANEAGYPPGPNGEGCTLRELANSYDIETHEVSRQFQRRLTQEVWRDYSLALDFRKALACLVHDPFLNPDSIEGSCKFIRQWLCGSLASIREVKPFTIFRKIDRTNARQILVSFLRVYSREISPIAVLTDLKAYYLEKNERGRPRYTRRHLFDLYETLREFIDAASEMEGTLMVFLAPREFIESERASYHQYRALQARIENEVRSRSFPNPCAAMVEL